MGEEARERERWETKKVVADEGGGGGGARRKAAEKLLSDDVLTSSDPIDAGIGPSFGKSRAKKGGFPRHRRTSFKRCNESRVKEVFESIE